MSTHNRSIKQEGKDLQREFLAVDADKIYDQVKWPCDPKTGQPYSLMTLLADDSLPLPESMVTHSIRLRRDPTCVAPLPLKPLTLSEIRQEASQAKVICFLTSSLTAPVSSSSSPTPEYVADLIAPH